MRKQILIKICGIKNPGVAFKTAKMGADFIGVVFHPKSKRCVTAPMAKMIRAAAKNGGAETVGVFVNHSLSEIIDICKYTGIKTVQLHGKISKSVSSQLPKNFRRIYQVNLPLEKADKKNIEELDKTRDFLIFDNSNGNGKSFDFNAFCYDGSFPFFLAGGLQLNTIEKAIQIIHPNGVDISSGVENENGEKDLNLIQHLITKVKNLENPHD